jgi:hypothetical protein
LVESLDWVNGAVAETGYQMQVPTQLVSWLHAWVHLRLVLLMKAALWVTLRRARNSESRLVGLFGQLLCYSKMAETWRAPEA